MTGARTPEQAFAVLELRDDPTGFAGRMRTGAWNLSPGGHPTAGSLGVLVDDVLALAVAPLSPSGVSVSTEITIDLARPVPTDGRVLTCTSGPVSSHSAGALITGRVTDDDGTLVALATQRQRFAPAPDGPVPAQSVADVPGDAAALHALAAGRASSSDGWSLDVEGSPLLANPVGNTHGGMSLYLSAVLGEAALLDDDAALDLGSIRIAHLRPMPVDERVVYSASVLHRGRTLRLAQVTAASPTGRVYTSATLTLQAA